MFSKVWLGFVGLGFVRLDPQKTTDRCLFPLFLEESLILLKAFRPDCHVAPKDAETGPEGRKGRTKSDAGLGYVEA